MLCKKDPEKVAHIKKVKKKLAQRMSRESRKIYTIFYESDIFFARYFLRLK